MTTVRPINPTPFSMSATINAQRTIVIADGVLEAPQNGYYIKCIYPDFGAIDLFIPMALFPNKDFKIMESGDNFAERFAELMNQSLPNAITGKFSRGSIGSRIAAVLVVTVIN